MHKPFYLQAGIKEYLKERNVLKKIAIITARGGSKRIPRKNIKDFFGKPIIAYSILAALQSKLFDEVMVSTDDEEIKNIAIEYGATVPFMRSEKNSDDHSGTAEVLLEVLETYAQSGKTFDYACCIYPTAPLLKVKTLQKAFELLKSKNLDSVFPVLRFGFPIQRALKMDPESLVTMFQPENRTKRSQDLEPAFHDAGQFYFLNVPVFFEAKALWSSKSAGIELNEMEAQDIDNLADWEIAEFKFNYQNQQKNQ